MELPGGLEADEFGVALSYALLLGGDQPTSKTASVAETKTANAPAPAIKKTAPVPAPAPAPKLAPTPAPKKAAPAPAPAPAPAADDDDDDDWFAEDDDEEEKPKEVNEALEKAKKAAMEKLAKKEAKQRSLCALEIKPWSTEQDLMELFKKVKKTVVREGLVWSENCELRPVAFGLKKIALTAVINQTISMDEIIEDITEDLLADEVQSMELLSMSLL
mmetsp:Transcript_8937/g.12420  ORF Transcript_8937/g.12420 Transcript_8937/m.12420 type:complete len:218 (+) Transcript_8937:47-700(+)